MHQKHPRLYHSKNPWVASSPKTAENQHFPEVSAGVHYAHCARLPPLPENVGFPRTVRACALNAIVPGARAGGGGPEALRAPPSAHKQKGEGLKWSPKREIGIRHFFRHCDVVST